MGSVNNPVEIRPTVSAIVVCYNEEDRIEDCLESLRWCDEIVVVDAFSTDRTPEISFNGAGPAIGIKRPTLIPRRRRIGFCWSIRTNALRLGFAMKFCTP